MCERVSNKARYFTIKQPMHAYKLVSKHDAWEGPFHMSRYSRRWSAPVTPKLARSKSGSGHRTSRGYHAFSSRQYAERYKSLILAAIEADDFHVIMVRIRGRAIMFEDSYPTFSDPIGRRPGNVGYLVEQWSPFV